MRGIVTEERLRRLIARANHVERQWEHAHADFDLLITVGSDEEVEEADRRSRRTLWAMWRAEEVLQEAASTMSVDRLHRAVKEVPLGGPTPLMDWEDVPF